MCKMPVFLHTFSLACLKVCWYHWHNLWTLIVTHPWVSAKSSVSNSSYQSQLIPFHSTFNKGQLHEVKHGQNLLLLPLVVIVQNLSFHTLGCVQLVVMVVFVYVYTWLDRTRISYSYCNMGGFFEEDIRECRVFWLQAFYFEANIQTMENERQV